LQRVVWLAWPGGGPCGAVRSANGHQTPSVDVSRGNPAGAGSRADGRP